MKKFMMILILTAIASTSALSISNGDSMTVDQLPLMTVTEKQFFNSLLPEQQSDLLQRHWSEKESLKGKEHLTFKRGFQYPKIIEQKKTQAQEALKGLTYVTVGSFGICTYQTIQQAVNAETSGQTIRVTNETFSADDATFNVNNKSFVFRGGYNHCGTSAVVSGKTNLSGNGMSFADSIIELTDTAGGMQVSFYDFFIQQGQADTDGGGGLEISGKSNSSLAQRLDVRLNNVALVINSSDFGGGVHMTDASLRIENSSNISTNAATSDGGGVYCKDGDINMKTDAVVGNNGGFLQVGNTADSDGDQVGNGGGFYLDNCDLILDASDGVTGAYIIANDAYLGGGVYATDSATLFTGTSSVELRGDKAWINLNTANNNGGGITAAKNSSVKIFNGKIKGNSAAFGAGVELSDSILQMERSTLYPCNGKCNELSENSGSSLGAALDVRSNTGVSSANLKSVWIENNSVSGTGSIIFVDNNASLVLNSAMLINNELNGSLVNSYLVLSDDETDISFSTIAGNSTVKSGDQVIRFTGAVSGTDFHSNIVAANDNLFDFGGSNNASETQQYLLSNNNIFQMSSVAPQVDPVFVSATDFHIQFLSPARNFGQLFLDPFEDIDGEMRPSTLSNLPDSGADENTARVGLQGLVCDFSTVTEAIAAAVDGDTIYIPAGSYVENPGDVNKSLTFVQASEDCQTELLGVASNAVVIDGSNQTFTSGGLFNITAGNGVTFRNMALQNAQANTGGIISSSVPGLVLDNTVVSGGHANIEGGGIFSVFDVLLINGSYVVGNTALRGGGISISSLGSISLENDSTIYNNNADDLGGGVYSQGDVFLKDVSRIIGNSATDGGGLYVTSQGSLQMSDTAHIGELNLANTATSGGGIFTSNAPIILTDNAVIYANEASFGGGVFADGGSLSLNSSSRIGQAGAVNTALINGGGVYLKNAVNFNLVNTAKVAGNHSNQRGGGIFVEANNVTNNLTGGHVENNSAGIAGGGIYVVSTLANPGVNLSLMTISNNQSNLGAGLYYSAQNGGGDLSVVNSVIEGNVATGDGGGIRVFGSQMLSAFRIEGTTVQMNSAVNGGGISMANNGTLTLLGALISSNNATNNGGGLSLTAGADLDVETSDINSNSAVNYGGGIRVESTSAISTLSISSGSKLMANQAAIGAGLSIIGGSDNVRVNLTLDGVHLMDNLSSFNASVLHSDWAQVNVTKTLFSGNNALSAVFDFSRSSAVFKNILLYDNGGSALFQRDDNTTFSLKDSTAIGYVGGLGQDLLSDGLSSPATAWVVENSIISGFDGTSPNSSFTVTTCVIDSTGEIGQAIDPLFVDVMNDDYHLQATSPAINRCPSGLTTDFDANPRPVGGGPTPYDAGAYEYQGQVDSDLIFASGFD